MQRVQSAGLLLILCSVAWVLMPIAIALGKDFSGGIGVHLWSDDPIGVYPSMLPWLWPLSALTVTTGVMLGLGRGYRVGLAVTAIWIGLGVLAGSEQLVVLTVVIFLCIFSGWRHQRKASV